MFCWRYWGWRRAWERNTSGLMMNPPVLLDIFLDAALWFDEREGRFAITFRRHDNRPQLVVCVFKIRFKNFVTFFYFFFLYASTNDGPAHLVRHYDVLIYYHKKKQKCINHQVTPFCCVCVFTLAEKRDDASFFQPGESLTIWKHHLMMAAFHHL